MPMTKPKAAATEKVPNTPKPLPTPKQLSFTSTEKKSARSLAKIGQHTLPDELLLKHMDCKTESGYIIWSRTEELASLELIFYLSHEKCMGTNISSIMNEMLCLDVSLPKIFDINCLHGMTDIAIRNVMFNISTARERLCDRL